MEHMMGDVLGRERTGVYKGDEKRCWYIQFDNSIDFDIICFLTIYFSSNFLLFACIFKLFKKYGVFLSIQLASQCSWRALRNI